MFGQQDGRAERTKETVDWLGATPQTPDGQTIVETDVNLDIHELVTTAQAARQQLEHPGDVSIHVRNQQELSVLNSMFTSQERARITYTMPPSAATV